MNVNKVCTVIEGPLGNKFKYKVTYDGVGYWCDVVPATKLHRLLLGVE